MTYDQALEYFKNGFTIMRRDWLGEFAILEVPATHVEWQPTAEDKAAKDWQVVEKFQPKA